MKVTFIFSFFIQKHAPPQYIGHFWAFLLH
ncbi:MAG: hypothetical protein RL757_1978 [Bacteroidota bacterium]|jgi:hypothetical protein